MTKVSIAVLYSLFAAFSIAINIGFQIMSICLYTGHYTVEVSIIVGTAVGLPFRYLLEKRYIFAFKCKDIAQDARLFILYTLMAVVSTAIFWSVEYAFHLIFATFTMRYVGGMIGLATGFYFKYQLDKNHVFVSVNNKAAI